MRDTLIRAYDRCHQHFIPVIMASGILGVVLMPVVGVTWSTLMVMVPLVTGVTLVTLIALYDRAWERFGLGLLVLALTLAWTLAVWRIA